MVLNPMGIFCWSMSLTIKYFEIIFNLLRMPLLRVIGYRTTTRDGDSKVYFKIIPIYQNVWVSLMRAAIFGIWGFYHCKMQMKE